MDINTMIIASLLLVSYTAEQFTESWSDSQRRRTPRHRRYLRRITLTVTWSALMLFAWWVFDSAGQDVGIGDTIGVLAFGVPFTFVVFSHALVVRMGWLDHAFRTPEVCQAARQRFKIGFIQVVLCLPTYFYCELGCSSSDFAKIFPGHMLFHILMPWGVLNMLFFISLLGADDVHQYPVIYDRRTHGFYFALFPAYHIEEIDITTSIAQDPVLGITEGQAGDAAKAHVWAEQASEALQITVPTPAVAKIGAASEVEYNL